MRSLSSTSLTKERAIKTHQPKESDPETESYPGSKPNHEPETEPQYCPEPKPNSVPVPEPESDLTKVHLALSLKLADIMKTMKMEAKVNV